MTIRILHHWACSGGTVLSRAIASLPQVVLLSEVHPLAYLRLATPKSDYAPTDLIQQLCLPHNGRDPVLCDAIWNSSIDALQHELACANKFLVLRSHSHIDFFTGASCCERPYITRCLAPRHDLLELVSVRHPLDSWIGVKARDWHLHFRFPSLGEFCRRALQMLAACANLPIIRYEDFTLSPALAMQSLGEILNLLPQPDANKLIQLPQNIALSGDSGRSSAKIAPRPRQAIPQLVQEEIKSELKAAKDASSYQRLCAKLGYDPDPNASHPFTLIEATSSNFPLRLAS